MRTVNLYGKKSSFVEELDINNLDQEVPPFVCYPPTFNVIRSEPINMPDGGVIFNVTLNWAPHPDDPYAASVEIRYEKASAPGDYVNVGEFSFEQTTYVVKDLDPDETYTFWIRCISHRGVKSPWVSEDGRVKVDDPLEITGLTTTTPHDWTKGIRLDWDDVWDDGSVNRKSLSHYLIRRDGSNWANAKPVTRRRASRHTFGFQRIDKRRYRFRVKAVANTGTESVNDARITVDNKKPTVPSSFRISSWGGLINVTGFDLKRSGATYMKIYASESASVPLNSSTFMADTVSGAALINAPDSFIAKTVYLRFELFDELTEVLNESPTRSGSYPIFVPGIGS
jgi:hypothetical protein